MQRFPRIDARSIFRSTDQGISRYAEGVSAGFRAMNCFMARRANRHDSGVPLSGKANAQRPVIDCVTVKYAG
jgi:hypothetical protein